LSSKSTSADEAFKRALKFLSYRARSEAEVRSKLTRLGFPQKNILSTLARLRSLNLLNDEIFARNWAWSRAERRGYGPLKVAGELRQKGISQQLVRQVLRETFGQQGVKERAKSLLEKKFRDQDLNDRRVLRRAADFLQRRGYHDDVIAELLREPAGIDE
jgi:regulatory protein